MTGQHLIKKLGQWEGYRVGTVGPAKKGREFWVELIPENGFGTCDGCGQECSSVHETVQRWIRDLPVFDKTTHLLVHRRRLLCPRCGPKLERISWLDRYSRHTTRLVESVARLCDVMSIKHVSEYFSLSWSTVKDIHKRHLKKKLGPVDLSNVELLAMDEFAIQKGHRYATVIIDPTCKKVLWVGRGRSRASIRPFFEMLGDRCKDIKAVAMDMNASFEQEVQLHCPQAEIVYDLFHVVAKYGREVIDRVRVDQANRLRDDKPARRVIKGSRWLLLRNRENIEKPEDLVRLDELLAANESLMTTYVMKDDLKLLWNLSDRKAAESCWGQWLDRAMQSGIEPLMKFAKRLSKYAAGIIAHSRWPLHTSLLEGINNKIKTIKRQAYGYRDDEYFFLRIRAAFPGIP
ncbi:Transposase [Anaerohalosphaera lusitana]|uniref:Transposase n=1 Tax=Anaerohalosphaera lusitana TaxID=1936003 RepID=A0A1U9NJ31_9BACT|nr:ISL3 family transposase [Anaerohalosphaera lusitana]AQT67797.1 Transposase [Anaerohalosphaera lusitana]AQT69165.1 Transposase [Anaerohalosphaera lusitana]AQT69175.1 Transposase [Anaerohalosphaera lusitana]AQT70307.1 Transposase [Anaerohalosphaera lusitana]